MSEKLKFLFVPVDGVGHFNACFGIASVLRDRGHSVTFAASEIWRGKLKAMGYDEELYKTSDESAESEEQAGKRWGEMIAKVAPALAGPVIELHKKFYLKMWEEIFITGKYIHAQLKQIVERVKPDAMILDIFSHCPALMESGIPWISSISVTPLGLSRDNVPPAYAGFPTEGNSEEWKNFESEVSKIHRNLENNYNQWLRDVGSNEEVQVEFPYMMQHSPYANIYMYPLELDYTAYRQLPSTFHRFDAFVRKSTETFEVPAKIQNGPGKLIYFSMGTLGSMEMGVMRKLISILSNSPNRFIVSKGPAGDDLDLAENMWGENNVPQLAIIPIVDLVITHGGNNTITESFYFGKRVLVLPLLFDQPDNAQRIFETGLGLQFNPYKVSEQELLVAIETLLGDDLLQRRMKSISQRIQSSNSQSKAADLVEEVARKHKQFKNCLK